MNPAHHERHGRRRWPLASAGLLAVAVLALGACGGADRPQIVDESGDPWMARGSHCVRESEEGPVRRVINRTDPELCGLAFKHRPSIYLRVVPPPGTRSQ